MGMGRERKESGAECTAGVRLRFGRFVGAFTGSPGSVRLGGRDQIVSDNLDGSAGFMGVVWCFLFGLC